VAVVVEVLIGLLLTAVVVAVEAVFLANCAVFQEIFL
jgi:hypothetical protein